MTASGMTTHIAVTLVYLVVSVASVVAATHFPTREDLKAAFVALDAILVAVILHEHILATRSPTITT
jgi:adenylate cyclase